MGQRHQSAFESCVQNESPPPPGPSLAEQLAKEHAESFAPALANYGGDTFAPPPQRASEPGLRFDAGKSRIDLIPPEFIEALGLHYGAGAKKYADRNWEKGMSWSRCYASAQRHMLAFWRGEEIDEETGTPHVIAAAWNMAALHWYGVHSAGKDDRAHRV